MIRVGFSTRPGNPVSRLIQWATGAPFSHVWILAPSPLFGCDLVIEAGERGFAAQAFPNFVRTNTVVDMIVPQHQEAMALGLQASSRMLGEGFDAGGLLGMAWVELARRWLQRKVANPFQSSRLVFCAEAVVDVMQAGDYPGAQTLPASATNPKDLYDFLKVEA